MKTDDILIYPNPVTNILHVDVFNEKKGAQNKFIGQMKIYDSIGRLILENPRITSKFSLDISDYPSGIYKLIVLLKSGKVTEKSFVKI